MTQIEPLIIPKSAENDAVTLNLLSPSTTDPNKKTLGTTLRGTIFVIMNSSLGAGMLALPLTVHRNGIFLGMFITVLVGVLSIISSFYIQVAAEATDQSTLGGIAEEIYGKKFQMFVDIMQLSLNFGFCVAYVIIINDQIPHVFNTFFHWEPQKWMVSAVFGCFLLFPLSSPRDIGAQKIPSFIALSFILFFICLLIFQGFSAPTTDVLRLLPEHPTEVLRTLPVLFYAYIFHVNIPKLYFELRRQSTETRLSHYATRRDKVLLGNIIAVLGVGLLYVISGLCGYYAFGRKVEADVLLNFNEVGGTVILLVRIAFAFVVSFSYPIYTVPSIVAIWHFYSLGELPTKIRLAIAFCYMLVCITLGTAIPNVSIAFEVVGSTAAVLILFIFPTIFYLKTKKSITRPQKWFAYFMAILGVIVGCVCTTVTILSLCNVL